MLLCQPFIKTWKWQRVVLGIAGKYMVLSSSFQWALELPFVTFKLYPEVIQLFFCEIKSSAPSISHLQPLTTCQTLSRWQKDIEKNELNGGD